MNDEVENDPAARARRGRPEMSHAARRRMQARIAKAADKLFQKSGYGAVSMRKIAAAVGCTPMALYSYFPAKIDILQTLWGGVFEAVFADVADAGQGSNPTDTLIALSDRYVTYWVTHPDHYRLVFMSEGVTQPEVSFFVGQPGILQRYAIFASAIERANAASLGEAALKLKLDSLLCMMHGIAHNRITISGYDWSSPRELVALCVRGIVES